MKGRTSQLRYLVPCQCQLLLNENVTVMNRGSASRLRVSGASTYTNGLQGIRVAHFIDLFHNVFECTEDLPPVGPIPAGILEGFQIVQVFLKGSTDCTALLQLELDTLPD